MKTVHILWFAAIIFFACRHKTPEELVIVEDRPYADTVSSETTLQHMEALSKEVLAFDSTQTDSVLTLTLKRLKLEDLYRISTTHTPYSIQGYFNDDKILDTAVLVRELKTYKDGLLITYGGSDEYIIIGAGKDVLSQGFDDLNWVGEFYKISKGEKIASNIDEATGEIRTEEIPDSKKVTLQTEGIFIHQEEACGGGIIYWHAGEYHWIQQE